MGKIIENELLKERLVYHKLKSGLDLYILPKPGYSEQFAIYATQYGSNDSQFVPLGQDEPIIVPDGIAHFLEHKLFEEEDGNVFEEYSRLGAQPNAFTNFNMTAYHFTSTENFYESLDVLMGFIGRPYFTDENVEKEKGIIAQEIRMYEDNPNWRMYFNLLGAMYHNHPVRKDIAGTVESIYEIDKETLYECYNTFYHPTNMVLFVAGDVDSDKLIRQAEEHFVGQKVEKVNGDIRRIYPQEPEDVFKDRVEENLAVSRPMFVLGFKDRDVGGDSERLAEKIIANDIILDMLVGRSSDIYNSLYEEGLIDSSFSAGYTGEKNYGHVLMSGQSSNPEKLVEILLKEIKERKANPWERDHFNRIQKKQIGQYIRGFNSIETTSIGFISMLFRDISLFDIFEKMRRITYEDVIGEFDELFDENYSSLSLIKPKS